MKSNRSIFNFILTTILTLFVANFAAYAVPAKSGIIKVKQDDGTEVEVKICGDEWFNWRTTTDGYPVAEKSGFIYYAQYNSRGEITISDQKVMLQNRRMTPPSGFVRQDISQIAAAVATERKAARTISSMSDMQRANFPCQGEVRSAIILVEYADLGFITPNPNEAFHNQLNQKDYSVAGATGSAKDYFAATSGSQFDGQFDVYGPYRLSKNRSYYGGNDYSGADKNPDLMVKEAAELAHEDGLDFSLYDCNNDGFIDNIFVYYAGHNEAEGGSADSVWPHKWSVSSRPRFDGKTLYEYACTSELRGATGSTIAGIGTFCHEFSHVFGLADHYDTNGYNNGYSYGLGEYDIMSSGSYNNDGNTPPLHNALELDMIGWATPTVIDQDQSINLRPIQNLETYKILTEVEGEYFLLENRNANSIVWDKYIPASGLIISHIDRSNKYLSYWAANAPNKNPAHECFKFINAGNSKPSDKNEAGWAKVPYPYNSNDEWSSISTPKAESWAGETIDYKITNITRSGENISFYASLSNYSGAIINIIPESDGAFVGETCRFNATVLPEGSNQNVTWRSTDETIATVSSAGIVEFLAEGEVKIVATSVDDPTTSGSYVAKVEKFQGARGVLTDSDNNKLKNTTLSFYYTKQVVGLQNVISYTRSMNQAPITVTTDDSGFYRRALSEGYYEVEASESGYEDMFMIINIGAGSNLINFELKTFIESNSTLISHLESETPNSFFGCNGWEFTALSRWSSDELVSVKGEKISRIKATIFGKAELNFVIYKDDLEHTPIYESASVTNSNSDITTVAHDIPFEEAITIEDGCDYYIGYSVSSYEDGAMPAAITNGSTTDNEYLLYENKVTPLNELLTTKGNWALGFYTQSSEQSTAIEVNPGQTSATLKWNSNSYKKFRVTYQSANGTPNIAEATSNEIMLKDLEPYSTYSVKIAGANSGSTYVEMFSTEFTTYAKTTSMPFIKLPSYDYTAGDLLELEILNGLSSDSITWYYDNMEINRNKVILDSGEHMITCKVKRGDNTYRVTRYINVK